MATIRDIEAEEKLRKLDIARKAWKNKKGWGGGNKRAPFKYLKRISTEEVISCSTSSQNVGHRIIVLNYSSNFYTDTMGNNIYTEFLL